MSLFRSKLFTNKHFFSIQVIFGQSCVGQTLQRMSSASGCRWMRGQVLCKLARRVRFFATDTGQRLKALKRGSYMTTPGPIDEISIEPAIRHCSASAHAAIWWGRGQRGQWKRCDNALVWPRHVPFTNICMKQTACSSHFSLGARRSNRWPKDVVFLAATSTAKSGCLFAEGREGDRAG